jgi:hypothetical protein
MIVGSRAFFENIDGFTPKDTDVLILVDEPVGFKNYRQFTFKNKCVFEWRNRPVDEFIDIELANNTPMSVCKFLVPEFIELKGVTIEQLKRLQPLVDIMDDKHKYLSVIYDSYVTNNGFYLTYEQLSNGYNEYKKYRE